MKKIISAICASALILTLSGCSKNDTLQFGGDTSKSAADTPAIPVDNPEDLELQKISDLRGDIDRQVESIKSAGYKNITLPEDFTVTIPETDVLYELELTRPELSFHDYFDKFDRIFDTNYGDIYTEADKASLYYAIANEDERGEHGYEDFTLAERRDKFESGELHLYWLYVDTDKARLEIVDNGGIMMMYHDGVKKRSNFVEDPNLHYDLASYYAGFLFKTVKESLDVDCGDRYELLDREISVNEAAEWVSQTVKEYGYIWGGDLEPRICGYSVLDINDGKYGLEFDFAPFYKGVMLDCGGYLISAEEEKRSHDYRLFPANVFIMESNKLETLRVGEGPYNVAELAELDSVIPLDKAVEIAAKKYSEAMDLSLGSANLRYSEMYFKDEEETVKGAFPVWKLTFKNSTDGMTYITYINAATGEMEYFLTE